MESGAIEVMLHQIQHPVVERLFMQALLAVLAVAVLTQLVHKVTTNVSTAVICIVPIVIAIAQDVGASAYMLAIVAGITSLLGFVFVVETIPSVIVQQAGYMTQKELLCPGLVLTIVSARIDGVGGHDVVDVVGYLYRKWSVKTFGAGITG